MGGHQGKHPWYLDILGGWMDPRAGLDVVVKKKSLPMMGIESLAIQPIGYNLTELSCPFRLILLR